MRAVNLIPADDRRGGGAGAGGRSGGLVYLVLGGLAGLAVIVALWAVTSSGLGDKRTELTALRQEAAAARARVAGSHAPVDLAAQRRAQTGTIKALIAQRHDWAATLDAIGRTLPADTTLTSLDATSTPAGSATAPAPAPTADGAAAGPTIQLGGCAPSQRRVALLMPRLRTIPGVTTVTLASSTTGGTSPNASTGADTCDGTTFQLTLALAAPAPAVATGAAAPPATGAAPVPAPPGGATPTTPAPAPAPAAGAPTTKVSQPASGTATTAVPARPTSPGAP